MNTDFIPYEGPVTIRPDDQGRVVRISSNPEYGFIVLEQKINEFNENGWATEKTRTALVKGTVAHLEKMGWTADKKLTGRITVQESHTSNNNEPDRELKYAGDTGVICRVGDQPIYRKTFWDVKGKYDDTFIQHDNQDEIKAAQTLMKRMSNLTSASLT
jgi:hypothetical protein